jgi:hypothetical protein
MTVTQGQHSEEVCKAVKDNDNTVSTVEDIDTRSAQSKTMTHNQHSEEACKDGMIVSCMDSQKLQEVVDRHCHILDRPAAAAASKLPHLPAASALLLLLLLLLLWLWLCSYPPCPCRRQLASLHPILCLT